MGSLSAFPRTPPEEVFEAIRVLEKAKILGLLWDPLVGHPMFQELLGRVPLPTAQG